MRALSLLNILTLPLPERFNYTTDLNLKVNDVKIDNGEPPLTNFLSQKFTPELIQHYFNFWELDDFNDKMEYDYINGDYKILFFSNRMSLINRCRMENWLMPDTLNRFISNCEQMNIELFYKIKD